MYVGEGGRDDVEPVGEEVGLDDVSLWGRGSVMTFKSVGEGERDDVKLVEGT